MDTAVVEHIFTTFTVGHQTAGGKAAHLGVSAPGPLGT